LLSLSIERFIDPFPFQPVSQSGRNKRKERLQHLKSHFDAKILSFPRKIPSEIQLYTPSKQITIQSPDPDEMGRIGKESIPLF